MLALVAASTILGSAPPAGADVAVVPTDFPTIQQAVNAVQGTADALVRIDSDAIFTETVTATQSVAIAAGSGFQPTIQGVTTSCGPFLGSCTVGFLPDSDATPTTFALRGVRLHPRNPGNSGHRVVLVFNQGDVDATVLIEDVVVDDPVGSGPSAIELRNNAAGLVHATVRNSSVTLGGQPGVGVTAFTLAEGGSLTVEDLTLVMNGATGKAFMVGDATADSVFSLTDSHVTLNAPPASYSLDAGLFVGSTEATIARNRFELNSNEQGFAGGFGTGSSPALPRAVVVRLDANTFVGTGPRAGSALSASPHANNTQTVVVTNNVVRGAVYAFHFNPQDAADPSDPAGVLVATLVNNTIHGASEDAVRVVTRDGSSATLGFFNNVVTHGVGCAIGVSHDGAGSATVDLMLAANGFFANAGGNVCGLPGGTHPDDVLADPLYVDATAGDLRLGPGSPMIDQGDNAAPELPATDVEGAPRIQNGTVDMGAFEAAPGGSTTTTTSPTTTTLPALLPGRVLQLGDHPTRPAKRRLLVVAKGGGIDLGAGPESADDPVQHGGRLRLWDGDTLAGDYELTGWAYRSGRRPEKGYRLKGGGPITRALLVPGKLLKIVGAGEALQHRLGETAPGAVSVELTLGSPRRYCLAFGGREKFKPGRRLVRRKAGPATGCGPAAAP